VVLVGAGLGLGLPAASQTGATLTINPTSGPVGTTITATITGCVGANNDGTARLDFRYVPGTPANTVMFVPAADGTATVAIEAVDKEGHAGATAAEVRVSQCKDNAFAAAPFTVVRTTTTTAAVTTTTLAGGDGRVGTTTTTKPATKPAATKPAATAKPSTGRIALTG